jgi:hypothetical protein
VRTQLRQHRYDWVILADDDLIHELLRYSGEQPVENALPVTTPLGFEMMGSKIAFLAACKAHDLPISESRTVRTLGEARAAANDIGYPVMLKLASGYGGSGVKKIDDPISLERVYATFSPDQPFTVERFVVGLIGGAEVLYDHGVPVCWSSYYKEKRWPGEFGPSAVRRVMNHPQVANIVAQLGALTGLHGFAVICFIHDTQRDELRLLEMNFRPGVGMHFRGPIRRMFTAGVRALLARSTYTGSKTPGAVNRRIHMFPQDLQRSIAERDYGGLMRLLTGGLLHDVPYDDLWVLLMHLRSLPEETRARSDA